MSLLILSFIAGVLTVAAPCILPLLPIIVGSGIITPHGTRKVWYRPLIITGSLAVSVIVFSLLLKASTVLLAIPQVIWSSISAGIVVLFGVNLLFPELWEKIMLKTSLYTKSNQLLGLASTKQGWAGDVLIGAALGPVFSSCSPTYALIVATVLPQSFAIGLSYLLAYALGLAAILLLLAVLGRRLVQKLGWLSNPHGWFRRTTGIVFILVGVALLLGLDRQFQVFVLEQGWYNPILHIEEFLKP